MISIIITHHRTPVLLKLCLKSIRDNLTLEEKEVFVCDSQTDPKIKQAIEEEFPEVNFVSFSDNAGYAKLVNKGLKKAQGDYLLVLNADILIKEKSVRKMVEYFEEHPRVGLIGPQLLTFANRPQESCFRHPTLLGFIPFIIARRTALGKTKWGQRKIDNFLIKKEDLKTAQLVDWLQGSALMVKKEAVEKVGLIDERYFMYMEDADWCRRFWEADYQVVYLPQAKMIHYYYRASRKWGGFLDILFNKYTRLHILSTLKYLWKWRRASRHYEF